MTSSVTVNNSVMESKQCKFVVNVVLQTSNLIKKTEGKATVKCSLLYFALRYVSLLLCVMKSLIVFY